MTTREQKLKVIPPSMRATYRKSATSRTAAIKAFCQECTGYTREHIKECPAVSCPLYAFRPYQTADESDESVPEEGTQP